MRTAQTQSSESLLHLAAAVFVGYRYSARLQLQGARLREVATGSWCAQHMAPEALPAAALYTDEALLA